jgi:hypothetical protein
MDGLGVEELGSDSREGQDTFLHCVQGGTGAHSASYTIGTGGSPLGVKRLESETDHSPPSSAEVNYPIRLHDIVFY